MTISHSCHNETDHSIQLIMYFIKDITNLFNGLLPQPELFGQNFMRLMMKLFLPLFSHFTNSRGAVEELTIINCEVSGRGNTILISKYLITLTNYSQT